MKAIEEIWQYMRCAQLVNIRMSLLNMGIDIVSYGKMMKIEVRLWLQRTGCRSEEQARDSEHGGPSRQ
jgi:hypothetical protein